MYKDNQRAKAWESTVRKTQQQQQQQQQGRRRGLVFQSMSVAPADDCCSDSVSLSSSSAASSPTPSHEDPDDSLVHAEKRLPNGDFYTGQWRHQVPHGTGKYLWTDGCMYEGEWRHGKTMGRGKFSWPSGATYEGDFRSGFMDGAGTYVGINGDTYRGGWSMNLKHGVGKKSYSNGDCYDGDWRSGMQDGHGRYIWKNGNEYVGQWRSGVIHGRGSLIWANGNRYDGGWEDGVPMGNGSFRWADGSLYIGIWSSGDDEEEKKGIYYPSPAASSPTARDPQAIFDRELPECMICPGETESILPSQKRLNWSGMEIESLQQGRKGPDAPKPRRRGSVDTGIGARRPNGRVHAHTVIGGVNSGSNGGAEKGFDRMCIWESDGDITCDIVDGSGMLINVGRTSTDSVGKGEDEPRLSRSSQGTPIRLPRTTKKQGETISKGHKNYDLMLNLQLGIRYTFLLLSAVVC